MFVVLGGLVYTCNLNWQQQLPLNIQCLGVGEIMNIVSDTSIKVRFDKGERCMQPHHLKVSVSAMLVSIHQKKVLRDLV